MCFPNIVCTNTNACCGCRYSSTKKPSLSSVSKRTSTQIRTRMTGEMFWDEFKFERAIHRHTKRRHWQRHFPSCLAVVDAVLGAIIHNKSNGWKPRQSACCCLFGWLIQPEMGYTTDPMLILCNHICGLSRHGGNKQEHLLPSQLRVFALSTTNASWARFTTAQTAVGVKFRNVKDYQWNVNAQLAVFLRRYTVIHREPERLSACRGRTARRSYERTNERTTIV